MKSIGLIGCGNLGSLIAQGVQKHLSDDYIMAFFLDCDGQAAERLAGRCGGRVCQTLPELLAHNPDYVVEAATADTLKEIAEPCLRAGCDVIALSAGALADEAFTARVEAAARRSGKKLRIASGALGGFDLMNAARLSGALSCRIVNLKSPQALGLEGGPQEERVIFFGKCPRRHRRLPQKRQRGGGRRLCLLRHAGHNGRGALPPRPCAQHPPRGARGRLWPRRHRGGLAPLCRQPPLQRPRGRQRGGLPAKPGRRHRVLTSLHPAPATPLRKPGALRQALAPDEACLPAAPGGACPHHGTRRTLPGRQPPKLLPPKLWGLFLSSVSKKGLQKFRPAPQTPRQKRRPHACPCLPMPALLRTGSPRKAPPAASCPLLVAPPHPRTSPSHPAPPPHGRRPRPRRRRRGRQEREKGNPFSLFPSLPCPRAGDGARPGRALPAPAPAHPAPAPCPFPASGTPGRSRLFRMPAAGLLLSGRSRRGGQSAGAGTRHA